MDGSSFTAGEGLGRAWGRAEEGGVEKKINGAACEYVIKQQRSCENIDIISEVWLTYLMCHRLVT